MKPSQVCQQYGVSLSEVARQTNKSIQTLSNWCRHNPDLFRVVVRGVAAGSIARKLEDVQNFCLETMEHQNNIVSFCSSVYEQLQQQE